MICRWKEILVAIFDAYFCIEVHRYHAAHFVEDLQKLRGGHVAIIRISWHPKLHDGLVPLVYLAAAIHGVE